MGDEMYSELYLFMFFCSGKFEFVSDEIFVKDESMFPYHEDNEVGFIPSNL